jgi:hypothetical protein
MDRRILLLSDKTSNHFLYHIILVFKLIVLRLVVVCLSLLVYLYQFLQKGVCLQQVDL